MTKEKISEYERFMALSDAEKDAEVAVFDKYPHGFPRSKTRPLNKADRELHRLALARGKAVADGKSPLARRVAAAGPGRPVIGKGAKPIAVTLERQLLAEVDRFAKKHSLKRSEMIAEGLRLVMQRRAG